MRRTVALGLAVIGPDRAEAQPIGLARELQALTMGGVLAPAQSGVDLEAEGNPEL